MTTVIVPIAALLAGARWLSRLNHRVRAELDHQPTVRGVCPLANRPRGWRLRRMHAPFAASKSLVQRLKAVLAAFGVTWERKTKGAEKVPV